MPSAYSIRADTEFLNRVRLAAKQAGVSVTTFVTAAVEARLNAIPEPPRLAPPVPEHALRGGPVVPRGTSEPAGAVVPAHEAPEMPAIRSVLKQTEIRVGVPEYARDPKSCAHNMQMKWMPECPSCGKSR